ncbi:MerR family transcriptional regulator [Rugosimonospora acidiphila]|uniref:MerR family transcriptional regulator n=1 Tax=Rugosimonospora acidiphila TaxID=556531 RepID=A0ABP9RSJ3_9ACTN
MGLLTIGAFARAARLSPKALRRYDQLGLLRPVAVDGESGYRFYDPAQLDRARLIVRLRRLGMPLARVRQVCDLEPAAAAEEVTRYWADVTAETAARERLAGFLVEYLSGRGSTMDDTNGTLGIRYAARSETGSVRTTNEDTAYAGGRLLAVADGMRGPGGKASAAAINALKSVEALAVPTEDLLDALAEATRRADQAVAAIAESVPTGEAVTTLTAMLWSGVRLALVHIGDTRAYLLRGGELRRLTHDHTYVQSLVDEGKLSPAEAEAHPQRALLVRALTGSLAARPDVSTHPAEVGDRYLLCSDGLFTVVPDDSLRDSLRGTGDPDSTVDELIRLAHDAGAPDNIAAVVADVVAV